MGETGAGKTTTALAILRLLPPKVGQITSGSIEVEGVNLLSLPEAQMRSVYRGEKIAMIFQEPMTSLNPVFTIGYQLDEVSFLLDPMIGKEAAREYSINLLRKVGYYV